ncbi:hypothetical protein F511_42515 [Dorcoceras hygrometricum]|uniref:Uncharacterized protein n=1 Tax=Dorcoceras hygrometricum TaxID=472368 RepID=A0A2Z7B916_9LAMI|nr:hypothetical protein F511_42515 [Dorcoceras hygrometricum]
MAGTAAAPPRMVAPHRAHEHARYMRAGRAWMGASSRELSHTAARLAHGLRVAGVACRAAVRLARRRLSQPLRDVGARSALLATRLRRWRLDVGAAGRNLLEMWCDGGRTKRRCWSTLEAHWLRTMHAGRATLRAASCAAAAIFVVVAPPAGRRSGEAPAMS